MPARETCGRRPGCAFCVPCKLPAAASTSRLLEGADADFKKEGEASAALLTSCLTCQRYDFPLDFLTELSLSSGGLVSQPSGVRCYAVMRHCLLH